MTLTPAPTRIPTPMSSVEVGLPPARWPAGPPAPPATLLDLLDASVRAAPSAPALDADGAVLDYAGLRAAAGNVAAALAERGIGPGDRVGVRVPSGTAELYVAVLGVLHAGAAYVPVDVDDPDERAAMVWQDAGVCAVLGPAGRILDGPGIPGQRVGPPAPSDDAWVIFTSGTTGRPKGVAVSHRSAAAFVEAEARLFLADAPLGPGDRVLAGLSVAFDASCEEMWLAWAHGACLVPAPRSLVKAGTELGPWLVERGISVVSTVPTLAALWPVEALDGVRLLIVGGEACPAELVERLDVPGREVWNTYGPTETTVVACAARLRAGQPVRIGHPLAGWEVAVVDPEGREVPWGGTGELLIAGVGTARYLDAEKDRAKFRSHPALPGQRVYRSGDLVRADPEGLVFVGRADDQVKLGGRRIELGEVEAALLALPGVRAAAASVKSTAAGGQVLVGYLVPEDPATPPDRADGRRLLLERLPAALVPVLAVLPELPTRTSGKVDRAALPWPLPATDEPFGDGPELTGTARWLAEQWQQLLGVPVDADSDFFLLGGSSLSAARLISALRDRHPGVGVADLYQSPRLGEFAARLDEASAPTGHRREVRPTPRRAAVYQALVLAVLSVLSGLRWVLVLGALDDVIGPLPWTVHTSWWLIGAGWLVLASAPGRATIGVLGARALTARLRPGSHPRGGSAHLRLWTAERIAASFNIASVIGTPMAPRYARMLGCRVGAHVDLHAMPPVTGLATFGDGCSVEPEADLAGWWLDGDVLHLGAVRIGAGARVGTRSMLMPGADIGDGADVAPGSCVNGTVPAHQRVHGSPARPDASSPFAPWPAPRHRRSRRWTAAYAAALPLGQLLPLLAAAPALWVLYLAVGRTADFSRVCVALLELSMPLVLATAVLYALLLAATVRVLSRPLVPGIHPAHGKEAWCAWLVHRLMGAARGALFPLYAGLLTPAWLRLLGARVGRQVEASTVLGLPGLMHVDDQAFLADDTLLAPFETRGGWMRLGTATVGRRSFVGNSAIVGPGRGLADDALVGVLSDAPPQAAARGSWLGRPGFPMHRSPEQAETARTYEPPRRLVWARAAVELCRTVPVLLSALLADVAVLLLQRTLDVDGLTVGVLVAGVLMVGGGVAACLLTTAAKWLLVGRFRVGQQPLWSSFVWRNELFDTFVEVLAMPWLGGSLIGTPFLALWLRTLGARIGRGVWCETHWLPETDLVRIGDGASLNRGVVVQTHLFHDRLMRMDGVTVGEGATVGPHAIALPGSRVGDGTVVGPSSLVMRGESVPDHGRWLGNPVARWQTGADPATG
ncbi:Pls/PosA family non-ribosomal peptide synthetase [Streptacidiphilus melanogenes]|uniref:Pls/PosA family non-ribosomal peptide synthetase n=1 Tax=Streptacidiphilus melanogenes TaxID=411235 RepID=UPI000A0292A4|nr:Pls/PosA family non-ribosomal peptide synthetase [Streptacidiphilus melanogenes]